MSLRLRLAALHVPARERRGALGELVERCARAFEVAPPALDGRSAAELLAVLGAFTAREAGLVSLSREATDRARGRLRAEGKAMGLEVRRRLGVASRAEAVQALRIVYGALGVDLAATPGGAVTVRRCGFAAHYAPRVCATMGAMDEGLFAGLAGEGTLAFSRRLTDGAPCCEATFTFAEAGP